MVTAAKQYAWLLLACVVVALVAGAAYAQAAEQDGFAKGVAALQAGHFEEAIDELEAYADRAPSHPDASYDRGVAYLLRVRNGAARPGDLGQAAAAFEETLLMDGDDAEAAHALSLVHAEVARRRSRGGRLSVLARPTLDRVIVGLTSERNWALMAVLSSWLLTLGLVLRRLGGNYRVAGRVMVPLGLLLLLLLLPVYLWARRLRTTTGVGVVVAREAILNDGAGNRLAGDAISEAAKVETGAREGRRLHVRCGARGGWVAAETVRLLRVR